MSGDAWALIRHVQWVAITWQLNSAFTDGYVAFSQGFMWYAHMDGFRAMLVAVSLNGRFLYQS